MLTIRHELQAGARHLIIQTQFPSLLLSAFGVLSGNARIWQGITDRIDRCLHRPNLIVEEAEK